MTTIAVVDHGAGNLVSIAQGLAAAGATVDVVTDAAGLDASAADGVVLPGVGATGAAMRRLREAGLVEPLRGVTMPLLGICVGLQLFFDSSDEDGGECLGMIPGVVRRLDAAPRLPHIGWNDIDLAEAEPIFAGIPPGTPFYFVHSFAPEPLDPATVVARSDYGAPFVAAVRSGTRVGVQFHPERSGPAGLRVLANFVSICASKRETERVA